MNKKSDQLQIDKNYTISRINFKEFIQKDPEPWAGQRSLDEEHVDDLVKQFTDNYEKYGNFLIRHPLYVTEINKKLYLLDGQHKYNALKKIINKNQDINFYIPVGKIYCNDTKSAEREYLILNYNVPQRLMHMEKMERDLNSWDDDFNDVAIIEDAFKDLKKIYTNFNDKKIRPHVNVESVKEEIKKHDIVNIYNITHYSQLSNYIQQLHTFYLSQPLLYFKNIVLKTEGNKKEELKRIENFYNDVIKSQSNKNIYHLLGLLKTNNIGVNGKPASQNYVNVWMNKLKEIIEESK